MKGIDRPYLAAMRSVGIPVDYRAQNAWRTGRMGVYRTALIFGIYLTKSEENPAPSSQTYSLCSLLSFPVSP